MTKLAQPIRDGVYVVDTQYVQADVAACYIVVRGFEVAIVETGTNDTTPVILSALSELGLATDQVKYVFVTHVHLDHAGGAGSLMSALPAAQLLVHSRGARHMVDPTKLQQGATAVYGEAVFKKMYGDLCSVSEDRVVAVSDGDTFFLNEQPLICWDTPGHAKHHMCIWDDTSKSFFTGDTFGLAYESLDTAQGRFIIPTTTPVQFEPEALKASIHRLMSKQPEGMYLTHFGYITDTVNAAKTLVEQIDSMVAIAEKWWQGGERNPAVLESALLDFYWQNYQSLGGSLSLEAFSGILSMDVRLNAQGLEVWLGSSH